jgi:SPP1 gp7 family putative phage head morphogenesis protein
MPKVKNSDYWKERFKQLEAAQNRKGAETYAEIEQQYRKALREIEGKISVWYQRLADNNGVSMAEARKMLSKNELKELKWDVNDYIKYGKENAIDQRWMKELENASAKFHISRLEALKLQTQQSLEVMFGNQLDSIDATMRRIYLDGYYHTAYEIQKGFQIGWDIAGLDQRKIEKVISRPWAVDGKNFSERIWEDKQKLISAIHSELTQDIILGRDPQKAIDAIARKMNTSKTNAGRLVMTEEAYFSSAAQKDCFEDLDVEEYQIVATIDSHTSDICQNMDGKVFPMKDYEAGVTAPPFHVWCRSCTVPYFRENFGQIGKRAARGKDGKTYYVPADMTYPEWKKAFVDSGNKQQMEKWSSDNIQTIDITKEWSKGAGTEGAVTEKQEYVVNGIVYRVDGKHVVLQPSIREKNIADILSKKYGKTVDLIPQVMYPQGIQTPDYLIDGERFDLKSPTGSGKNLLYGLIAKKQKQSHNFIVDVTKCPLSIEELEKQAKDLYRSPRVGFLERIVFMKDGEIVKVFDRKLKNKKPSIEPIN